MTAAATTTAPVAGRADVEALVTTHLPIVGYQVNETMARLPGHVLRDDLVSAGMAALVAAARGYDAATGVPFARYATLRIRGALIDELRGMDWAPRGARARARALEGVEEQLTLQLGRRPRREELATAMGCDPSEVDSVRGDAQRAVVSLEAYDGALGDVLPVREIGPEEHLLQREQVRYLHAAVEALPERLRAVVSGLFLKDRSVAELAADLGVTESRISQLRTEALLLMKDGMNTALEPSLVAPVERPGGVVDRRRQAYFAAVVAGGSPSAPAPETPVDRAVRAAAPARASAGSAFSAFTAAASGPGGQGAGAAGAGVLPRASTGPEGRSALA